MNKRKVIAGVVIIALIAVVYGTTTMYTGEGEVTATLIIENGGTVTREATLPEGSTVFDLMTACRISFEEKGGLITSINGVSQDEDAGKYWLYYINGEFAQTGAGEYIVQEGDEITWKLESF
ncbi:MAG: DUF4430 domain-containing protein [Theionarchaea archaeon]|nr:DUF4430 domain-containing protein [Theionarchaea archaeon]